jgi:DNA helicase-2/ATP-dependent DNA helicase PcrA
MIVNE